MPPVSVPGLQESLWLYPENEKLYGPWPDSGEIDYAEFYSDLPDADVPVTHYPGSSNDPNASIGACTIPGDATAGQLNTYGRLVDPDHHHHVLQRRRVHDGHLRALRDEIPTWRRSRSTSRSSLPSRLRWASATTSSSRGRRRFPRRCTSTGSGSGSRPGRTRRPATFTEDLVSLPPGAALALVGARPTREQADAHRHHRRTPAIGGHRAGRPGCARRAGGEPGPARGVRGAAPALLGGDGGARVARRPPARAIRWSRRRAERAGDRARGARAARWRPDRSCRPSSPRRSSRSAATRSSARRCSLAWRTAASAGALGLGGSLRLDDGILDGDGGIVLGGRSADVLLLRAGDDVVVVRPDGDGSRPRRDERPRSITPFGLGDGVLDARCCG